MNGPEPMNSVICLLGSVSAMRLGIMKGTLDETLPSASSTRPNGCLEHDREGLGVDRLQLRRSSFISSWPEASRAPQRLIEAMQSSAVTGVPSLHTSPSRSVMV